MKRIQIASQNVKFKIGHTKGNLNLELGSGCTIINLTLATNIMQNCEHAKWSKKKSFELKLFLMTRWKHCQH